MSKSASVRTRKRGKTYSYIFEAGKTPEGKRKVIEKGGYPTKQAAYDAGVAAYNDWKHGNIGITSEKITVKEFMTNWLENIVAPTVKSTTLIDYRACFKSRILPYIGNFIDELQQWQHQQLLNEESVGESYIYIYRNLNGKMIQQSKGLDNLGNERVHLICTQTNGRAVSRTMMRYCLEKENLNSHSFRHTHATMLIENGATPKGVAGRLGHADTSITENIYTHNTEKIQENTIAIFEKIMQTKL